MKKLLSSGMLIAAAMCVSLSADAQQVQQYQYYVQPVQQPMSQGQIMSYQEIVIGPYGEVGVTPAPLPQIAIGAAPMQVEILNPTSEAITFNVPALNISHVVPANSARILHITEEALVGLTPGQQVAYHINDASGNLLASSTLIYDSIAFGVTEAEAAIIEEPETPAAITRPEAQAPVRGFW